MTLTHAEARAAFSSVVDADLAGKRARLALRMAQARQSLTEGRQEAQGDTGDATNMSETSWYMHTLNGQPAAFDERAGYIFYIGRRMNVSPLVPNLRTIRRQQAAAMADDAKLGQSNRYGYICFARKARP